MKPYMIAAFAATAVALGACRNGSNNARDTTGMPNNSAAGSISPGSGLGPGATTGVATPTPSPGAAGGAMAPGAGGGAMAPGAPPGTTPPMDTSRDTTHKHQKQQKHKKH